MSTHYLIGIEQVNLRITPLGFRGQSERREGIVDIGRAKSVEAATEKAIVKFSRKYHTNPIALKVVSVKKVVDGVDETLAPQRIEQVIYDSAKQVDTAFSVAPAPKFENFTIGNMTLRVRSETA